MNLENYTKEEKEDGTIVLTPIKPKEEYNYVITGGGVISEVYTPLSLYHNRLVSKEYNDNFNVYSTKRMAEKAARIQRLSNAVTLACLLVDPDFVPDWRDRKQVKYSIYYNNDTRKSSVVSNKSIQRACAYVSSDEHAREVINLLNRWGVG